MEPKSAEQIQQVVKEARELVSMLERTSVRRVCEAGDFEIEIERAFGGEAGVALSPSLSALAPAATGCCDQSLYRLGPLVGTFYRSSSPGAKPFVEVGNRVQRGQPIGIIEAMKLMNEVVAEAAGVVVEILVENAQSVQHEQPLLVIDTTA